jgi:hypothetical protein
VVVAVGVVGDRATMLDEGVTARSTTDHRGGDASVIMARFAVAELQGALVVEQDFYGGGVATNMLLVVGDSGAGGVFAKTATQTRVDGGAGGVFAKTATQRRVDGGAGGVFAKMTTVKRGARGEDALLVGDGDVPGADEQLCMCLVHPAPLVLLLLFPQQHLLHHRPDHLSHLMAPMDLTVLQVQLAQAPPIPTGTASPQVTVAVPTGTESTKITEAEELHLEPQRLLGPHQLCPQLLRLTSPHMDHRVPHRSCQLQAHLQYHQ